MITLADGVPVDLPRLLETRLLIQANSGGGKSWALRRLLEQTANHVQQIVIDPEGEFATLRERFDYVVCAAHDGDAVAHPRTAKLLARRLLETGVSAILDIYDLMPHERKSFVKLCCDEIVNAPKSLWHPVMIVLDEAHMFAPESGSAESLGAVIDLATRGRKRGYCLIAATQRLSKLHKDVAAEMNNKLIGRTGLDVDVKRAADELGMSKSEAMHALKFLDEGEWYVFGPALSRSITKIKVGPVTTTHPKAGQRLLTAPPEPSAKVRRALAELADLPQQAESEARSIDDMKRENANLKRSLTIAQKAQPVVNSTEVPKLREETKALRTALNTATDAFKAADSRLRKIAALADVRSPDISAPPPVTAVAMRPEPRPQARRYTNGHDMQSDTAIGRGERSVLTAIAQHAEGVDREKVTILTGYKRSTRDAYIQRLAAAGLVDLGPPITVTEAGAAVLPADFAPLPTGDELREHWLARLPAGEAAVFRVLVDSYPNGVSRDEITEITLYKRSTRDAYIQRLGTRKLVKSHGGQLFAEPRLFE